MSLLAVQGGATGTGTVTLLAPVTNSDRTLTLPDQTATLITDSAAILNIGSGQVYKDASGNVGIGTSSPSSFGKLAVNGNIVTTTDNTFIGVNDGTENKLSLVKKAGGFPCIASASSTPIIFSQSSATSIVSASAETYTERARIDSSGNLLVGTTSASAKITTVVGSGQVGYYTNKSSAGGGLDHAQYYTDGGLQGKITQTGGFTTVSDYRIKSDLSPLTNVLASVCKLRPLSYTLTAFNQQQIGFVAHELQQEFPSLVDGLKDAVNEDGSFALQSVDYPKMVAVLTAAIQELKAIVDAQGAEIAALKGAAA